MDYILKDFRKKKIGNLLIPLNKLQVFNFHKSSPNYTRQLNGKFIWSSFDFLLSNYFLSNRIKKGTLLYEGFAILKEGWLKGDSYYN